jgi:hypothetical protein
MVNPTKWWREILCGLVVIYAVTVSILYNNLSVTYKSAVDSAARDAERTTTTIADLTVNLESARQSVKDTRATVEGQSLIISGLTNTNRRLEETNRKLISIQSDTTESNNRARELNNEARQIVERLISISK